MARPATKGAVSRFRRRFRENFCAKLDPDFVLCVIAERRFAAAPLLANRSVVMAGSASYMNIANR